MLRLLAELLTTLLATLLAAVAAAAAATRAAIMVAAASAAVQGVVAAATSPACSVGRWCIRSSTAAAPAAWPCAVLADDGSKVTLLEACFRAGFRMGVWSELETASMAAAVWLWVITPEPLAEEEMLATVPVTEPWT